MKRIALGIIIVAVLMFVGCGKVETPSSEVTTIEQQEQSDSTASSPSSTQTTSPSDDAKTYEDETHKEIQYGKLSFNIGSYHIVSDVRSDSTETFKCEIDKGVTRPETQMTITIQEIEKQEFLNTESIISYLSDMSPEYEKIKIYYNVTDDSGISGLYSVIEGSQTKYVVCCRDSFYLIESDYSKLSNYLFKNDPTANYEVNNQKIECADSFTAYVNDIISYNDNKAVYDVTQGKDKTAYSAELSGGEDSQYNFTLKNEKDQNLLTLSTYASDIKDVIKFLDVNMDGYADIQFLEEEGTMNNSYALYVWDDSAKNFIKVKCDEMLSNIEVHADYLLNLVKEDGQSGVRQKLLWDKNTLVKESEEKYQTD